MANARSKAGESVDGTPAAAAKDRQGAKWGVLLVLPVVLVALVVAYVGIKKQQPPTGIEKGNAAPTFNLARYSGGTVSLEDLRGKVVMLNFWATWCVPCVAEMPSLTGVARDYESKGFVFLAINLDEPQTAREQVGLFVAQVAPGLAQSVVFADASSTVAYGVEDLPTTYLIGRNGRILTSHIGYVSQSLLRKEIESALGR